MSFTVVIKDNESGKILFASEKTKALVLGAVADEKEDNPPATALASSCTEPADMAIAIALAQEAIDGIYENDPILKMLEPVASQFITGLRSKQVKKEDLKNGD